MVETFFLKVAVLGSTVAINCEGKKLRGRNANEGQVADRKLGKYWVPGDATSGLGYYGGISFDASVLPTKKPTSKPTKKPSTNTPTNKPTSWMGDAYPTLSPTVS